MYGGRPTAEPPRNNPNTQIFQPWRNDADDQKLAASQTAALSIQDHLNQQEILRRRLQLFSLANLCSIVDLKRFPYTDRPFDIGNTPTAIDFAHSVNKIDNGPPHVGVAYSNPVIFPNKAEDLSNQFVAGRKVFPCPQCRYTTDRRNNLKRHMLTMHQTCPKLLECCGILFSTKASLREHAMIFHYHGYHCFYCGRRFCRKALLKRHLSVHSGQKDFTCAICDYATSHKSNLERHRKVHYRQHTEGEGEDGHTSDYGSSKGNEGDANMSSDDEIDVSSD